MNFPSLTITQPKRLLKGHPWVYSNEVNVDKTLAPGIMARLVDARGRSLGIGFYNPHSLIAVRVLTRDDALSPNWLLQRLERALHLRNQLLPQPFYRWVHAEGDNLPGLIVDRYGDQVVCQLNTAGMDRLQDEIIAGLESLITPKAILFRNDSTVRQLEGLPLETKGNIVKPIEGIENGTPFLADLSGGQKTGWFYDQRDNRALAASLCRDQNVLDCYAYTGSFTLQALAAGAKCVTLLDRSESAVDLARQAAALLNAADRCEFLVAEAFQTLPTLSPQSYGVVILDPPAFVKSRKDLNAGLKGYAKLIRLGAALVAPQGFLMITSCSHPVTLDLLQEAVREGLHSAGRHARILKTLGAGVDHPVHPYLPETAYLKGFLLAMD